VKGFAWVGLAIAAALMTGCSDAGAPAEELTVEQACTEIKEPMLAPSGHEDGDAQKVVELLRSVADRGDEEAREIFEDAARAIEEYGDPDLDQDDVPPWVDDALGRMVSACGAIIDDDNGP
jgi:hypothetical protein